MAAKKIKNTKRLKKLAPEELEDIWDKEVSESWKNLNHRQQKFLGCWLSNGYNASQAYRDVYNDLANDATSAACGCRILSNANIQDICGKLSNNNKTELLSIKKVFNEALNAETPIFGDGVKIMDIEDHKTRILAANSLAKLNGELIERSEKKIDVHNTLIINEAQREDINSFLQSTGQPPLKPSKPVEAVPMSKAIVPEVVIDDVEDVVFGSFGNNDMDMIE